MDAKLLDGKTAIITGASYGMGRSMAELLRRKEPAWWRMSAPRRIQRRCLRRP